MLFNNPINRKIFEIPLVQIKPSKNPVRKTYSRDTLSELAVSIEKNGIIQPLTVRRISNTEYELIAGERRLRAAAICGLATVPCMVVSCTDTEASLFSLTENLQRSELNFLEEAESLENIITACHISRQELAGHIGKRPSAVARKLRYLELGYDERKIILKAHLTERHACAILKIPDKTERRLVLCEIVENSMNVSQSEQYIDSLLQSPKKVKHLTQHQKAVIKDIRLFENTINKAVDTMRDSGIPVTKMQTENDDFIEYVVRIPKITHDSGLTA